MTWAASSGHRLLHVAENVSAIAGGVPAVVHQLSSRLVAAGMAVNVLHSRGSDSDLPEGVGSLLAPVHRLGEPWAWGPSLFGMARRAFDSKALSPDLVHVHGVWSAPQFVAARQAAQRGIPFVVTAHGMLEPWLWKQQGWSVRGKKEVFWRLLGRPTLSRARFVHAITPMERDHLRTLFPRSEIAVIPNAIDVPVIPTAPSEREPFILFLGRLEPKKGVDLLLIAFARAGLEHRWKLKIAGPVWSEPYHRQLTRLVDQLGLLDRVEFCGPVLGPAKDRLLESAWVMAAPSHSEVMGLVNLEAAIRLLPSITTPQTGLHDWASGGGMLVQPESEDLARALKMAAHWSADEQRDRGVASRRLVESRYSWPVVLPLWLSLYESMLKH